MLTDQSQTTAISSMGWVDHGSLWAFRPPDHRPDKVHLSGADYLSLNPGRGDHFSVGHHFRGGRFEVTVHHFDRLAEPLAGLVVSSNENSVWGDDLVWRSVPTNYIAYHNGAHWSDFCLVSVHAKDERVELQQFGWYDDAYDKGYQGIVSVVEVPERDLLVISVQRDSNPVLYDPIAQKAMGKLRLADRGGNPKILLSRDAKESWVVDYDTVLRLETETWNVIAVRRLQEAAAGTQQFIGECWLDPKESMLLAARPFSGDVLGLNPKTLETERVWKTERQPLDTALLADGTVVARDWRSGMLLEARAV